MNGSTNPTTELDYDVLVIGSGFGGSVTALRLTEKGYRVGVIEAGARFEDGDFAATSFDTKRYLFRPEIGCYGIQRIDALKDCLILSGAGVGGGSLVYANTLYEPLEQFYDDPSWKDITDWRGELAPYYDQAKRMLGVTDNPRMTPSDEVMKQVADELGVGDTFRLTPVGVFFGGPGQEPAETVADPFFGGAGPDRNPCSHCGECMTGCRHNAKNTLVKNYLYLAEQNGARVLPMTTVTRIWPRDDGGYDVEVRHTKSKLNRPGSKRVLTADQVVLSASALGTQRLLHRMKDEGYLPRLSDRLGHLSRTNSESILGAIAPDTKVDYSQGVAITSSFHPDEHTHIEPVHYGKGSNAMSLLQTVLTDGDLGPRWQTWIKEMWRQKRHLRDLYDMKHWSERAVIALVMQSRDNSIQVFSKARPVRPPGAVLAAGPRRAQPDLDPDRQPGRTPDGRDHGRLPGRIDRRALQHAADRPLHRRLHDRRDLGDRRHRCLPARVRPPRPAHRGRLDDLGEPGREPVADHHRPGGAGDGVLAEQGRGRPTPRARHGVPADLAGRAEEPGRPRRGAGCPAAADRGGLLTPSPAERRRDRRAVTPAATGR